MYVNYAPYGNAGYILDYLKKNFDHLIYVSFSFHPMGRRNRSISEIYFRGKLIRKISLLTLPVPKSYVYRLAPLLSLIAALEVVMIALYVFFRVKIRPQIFFAPNAFLIFIGFILRALSLVDKVVFWVWDYYPIPETGLYHKLLYRFYWLILDRWSTYKADFVWYLNERLLEVREKSGVITDKNKQYIAPLGVEPISNLTLHVIRKNTLGFMGVIKKHQGLELLLDSLPELVSAIPDIKIEVIGSGPDEGYFKTLVENSSESHHVICHGFIPDEKEMKKIIASWAAATAPYVPFEDNLSAYTDPAKVKFYLGCGAPVIITKVPPLAQKIHQRKAGIAIEYNTKELLEAVKKIFKENDKYRKNALRLAQEYNYTKIYNNAFSLIKKQLWPI